MSRISRRTGRAALAGGALAALVTACGSATVQPAAQTSGPAGPAAPASPHTASVPPATGTGTATPGGQCPASALHATVHAMAGGAAAGTTYVPVTFTNVSGSTCVLYGFPGVSWVTGQGGSQLGDAASRQATDSPVTVTLATGGTAHAWLGVADAGNFPPAQCHQVTAHWLKIYPPDQYSALYAGFTAQVCSARITGGSTPLTVTPVRSGPPVAGQVP